MEQWVGNAGGREGDVGQGWSSARQGQPGGQMGPQIKVLTLFWEISISSWNSSRDGAV